MGFMPNMRAETRGIRPLSGPEWRSWNGCLADYWTVSCAQDAGGRYMSPTPRVFVTVGIETGTFELATSSGVFTHRGRVTATYVPAKLVVEGRARQLKTLKHLDVHMTDTAMDRLIGFKLPQVVRNQVHWASDDPIIESIAHLLINECTATDRHHVAFGEGLVSALLVRLFKLQPRPAGALQVTKPTDVDRIIHAVEASLFKSLRTEALAQELGMSERQMARKFQSSMGQSLTAWHAQRRIEHVKTWLADTDIPLKEAAARAGFADQAHLSRVFKAHEGITPSAWRRGNRG